MEDRANPHLHETLWRQGGLDAESRQSRGNPRKRKILLPPIGMNNKATGSGKLAERKPTIDLRPPTPAPIPMTPAPTPMSLLSAADVIADASARSYRRLIGTPPPRSVRRGDSSNDLDPPPNSNFPSIRVQPCPDTASGPVEDAGAAAGAISNLKGLTPPPRVVLWNTEETLTDVVHEWKPPETSSAELPPPPLQRTLTSKQLVVTGSRSPTPRPLTKVKIPVRLVPMKSPMPRSTPSTQEETNPQEDSKASTETKIDQPENEKG